MKLKQKWTISNRFAFGLFLACLVVVVAKYVPGWSDLPRALELWLGSDHRLHAVVGFCLTVALATLTAINSCSISRQLLFFLVLLALYGVDELVQLWVPHRQFSGEDFGASATGWAVAVFSWLILPRLARVSTRLLNKQ